jgi:hypothetical protein
MVYRPAKVWTGSAWDEIGDPRVPDKSDKSPTQNPQTGTTYSFVSADVGKLVTAGSASASVYTLPAQATVTWAADTQLSFMVIGAGTVTLSWPAGVTVNGLASGNTSLTLATSKGGSLVRTAINTWTFIPFSGGVDNANFTNTATRTYTVFGADYKVLDVTSTSNLILDKGGLIEFQTVSGGGGGGSAIGGGGGGGGYFHNAAILNPGTYTITIGAGGAVNTNGGSSQFATFDAIPGGGGGSTVGTTGLNGSSGGGGGRGAGGGTTTNGSLGNNPGSSSGGCGGTGGGAGLDGNSSSGRSGGGGGAGRGSNFQLGTSISFHGGGGGAGGNPSDSASAGPGGIGGGGGYTGSGTINTGGGGGGGSLSGAGAGGSGIVIIRVRTN